MKRPLFFLISVFLISSTSFSISLSTESNFSSDDSITVMSSGALLNLSTRWVAEFNRAFPLEKIRIITVPDNEIAATLTAKGNLGLILDNPGSGITNAPAWKMSVGRDVIVPIINSENPFMDEILMDGISPDELNVLLNDRKAANWDMILKSKKESHASVYMMNNASIVNAVTDYMSGGIKPDVNLLENNSEVLSSVRKDIYAIGFCRITDISNPGGEQLMPDFKLLPVDRNGNGVLESTENIYSDLNSFERGIWIGKYPQALISNICLVSAAQPVNESEINFLKWILNDGQQFLYSVGYSDLLVSERITRTDILMAALKPAIIAPAYRSVFKTLIISLVLLILAGLVLDFGLKMVRRRSVKNQVSEIAGVLDENSLILPKGLYFDKTHTWAFMEQNGFVKVGVDDFMQHLTGTISRIRMRNAGDQIKKGDEILSIIHNGKQLNLYSPVTGIIKERNSILENHASLLNTSPYNEGWVYSIEPSNWSRESQLLFMSEKQRQFIKDEISKLKDFLSALLTSDAAKYPAVVLQDGGALADAPLANMGPEVWEEFQTKFIDPSRQIWFYEIF
jgi:glycine cleavage system H lipoate-binding protein/ABC-type phosphate transport system substrate-binding protein